MFEKFSDPYLSCYVERIFDFFPQHDCFFLKNNFLLLLYFFTNIAQLLFSSPSFDTYLFNVIRKLKWHGEFIQFTINLFYLHRNERKIRDNLSKQKENNVNSPISTQRKEICKMFHIVDSSQNEKLKNFRLL